MKTLDRLCFAVLALLAVEIGILQPLIIHEYNIVHFFWNVCLLIVLTGIVISKTKTAK